MSATEEDLRRRISERLQQPTQEDKLRQRIRGRIGQQVSSDFQDGPTPNAFSAFITEGFTRFLNNALGLPEAFARSIQQADDRLMEGRPEFAQQLRQSTGNIQRPDADFIPEFEDLVAGAQSIPALLPGGETPGEAFTRNRSAIDLEQQQMREDHPIATKAGEISGDIATIMLGRKPVSGMIRRFERGPSTVSQTAQSAGGLTQDIGRILTSSPMRRLARGAGRSVETGVEAAMLEVVKGGDPIETAAMAAGSQALGSAFIHMATKPRWVAAAALAGGGLQLLKSATPGGRDRVLESIESGFDKVAYGIAIGAASSVLGASRYGRANPRITDQTAQLLDGISTAHRGAILSVLTDWTKSEPEKRAEIESAIENIADPEYEGRTELQRQIVDRLRSSVNGEDQQ